MRVLFSRKGETADELIRRLVRAEPAGRPVVVISSDREVADGVRRHGAYPLQLGLPAAPARPLLAPSSLAARSGSALLAVGVQRRTLAAAGG